MKKVPYAWNTFRMKSIVAITFAASNYIVQKGNKSRLKYVLNERPNFESKYDKSTLVSLKCPRKDIHCNFSKNWCSVRKFKNQKNKSTIGIIPVGTWFEIIKKVIRTFAHEHSYRKMVVTTSIDFLTNESIRGFVRTNSDWWYNFMYL